MTLFLSLILFTANAKATAKIPVVTLAGVNQPPSTITATYSQSATLDPNADNAPTINAFLDSLPEGVTVTLPEGIWPVNSRVQINKRLELNSASGATIRLIAADANMHVLRVGQYHANVKVNGVTIRRLTLEIDGSKTTGLYNCVDANGDDFTAEDCVFRNCPHEGIVVSGNSKRPIIRRCRAENCGTGNQSYFNSTAGFNSHGWSTVYEDCVATGCGQGFEIDAYHTRVRRCRAEFPAGTTPSIAFNVGSVGTGIWDVEIDGCTSIGYETAVQSGNGIGRFAGLNIHDCIFDGGCCHVMGGVHTNTNPGLVAELGEEGPDGGQSHIDRNVFIVRQPHQGLLGVSMQPSAEEGIYGREAWTFDDNVVVYIGTPPQDCPGLFIGGMQMKPVSMQRNKLFGMDTAPSRGDIQTFTSNGSVAVPGQPNLTLSGNLAFKVDGTARPVVIRIEGAAP